MQFHSALLVAALATAAATPAAAAPPGPMGAPRPQGAWPARGPFADPPPSSGGCPAFLTTPSLHAGWRFESYAHNDPTTGLADQGSLGLDFTQVVGSKQPAAQVPCQSGKLNDLPCGEGDAGDILGTAATASQAQPNLTCLFFQTATGDVGTNTTHMSGENASAEHEFRAGGASSWFARAGSNITGGTVDDDYHAVCIHWNGASSEMWLDGVSISTGNTGAEPFEGLNLFARFDESLHSSGKIVEVVHWDTVTVASTMVANVQDVWDCVFGGSPQTNLAPLVTVSVDVPGAVKRYARRLALRGATPRQIGERVRDRLVSRGYLDAEAEQLGRQMARAARGRAARDADTLHTVRVGLATRPATAAAHGALVAEALCESLVIEDGPADPVSVACLAAETQYLAERWCVAGTNTEVLRGARAWLTTDDYQAVLSVVQETPALRGIRDADDTSYETFIQAAADALPGSPTVERCQSGAS